MSDAISILIADDDPGVRAGFAQTMTPHGWQVTLAADGFEAIKEVRHGNFDLILLDMRMPHRSGADVLRILRNDGLLGDTRVMLLAQPGDSELVERAMKEGADGVFDKSVMGPRDITSEIQVMLHGQGRAPRRPPKASDENVPDDVQKMASRFKRSTSQASKAAAPFKQSPPRGGFGNRLSQTHSGQTQGQSPGEYTVGPAYDRPVKPRIHAYEDAQQDAPQQPAMPGGAPGPVAPQQPYAQPPPAAQSTSFTGAPVHAGQSGPFNTVLNKMFGEAAKLAQALGFPADFTCPVCRNMLVLKLWPNPNTEGGVLGHFFCPNCNPR